MAVMSRNNSSRRRGDGDQEVKMKQQKQGAKFFTRIMSKDIATPNPSFRVYYGGAPRSVPFTWESAPGTPKHGLFSSSDSSNLPPLTPPPSFYSSSSHDSNQYRSSAAMKLLPNFLLRALFPARNTSTTTASSSSRSGLRSSSYSSQYGSNCSFSYSSSASSSPTTTDVYRKKLWRSRCFSCSSLPVHHQHELKDGRRSAISTKSLGGGWYSFGRMRNAFFSVVRGGTSGGTC